MNKKGRKRTTHLPRKTPETPHGHQPAPVPTLTTLYCRRSVLRFDRYHPRNTSAFISKMHTKKNSLVLTSHDRT
ncbi:MAG: hypothetical protein Q7U45_05140, partial [Burkholderiaceae bacterium]|nr:hypothetical protein [Burkholderiaceae bacterium]